MFVRMLYNGRVVRPNFCQRDECPLRTYKSHVMQFLLPENLEVRGACCLLLHVAFSYVAITFSTRRCRYIGDRYLGARRRVLLEPETGLRMQLVGCIQRVYEEFGWKPIWLSLGMICFMYINGPNPGNSRTFPSNKLACGKHSDQSVASNITVMAWVERELLGGLHG